MIDAELEQQIAAHALGALAMSEGAALDRVAADDPQVRAALDRFRDAATALARVLPAVAPGAALRLGLDDALDAIARPGRFDAFAAQVASLFDVTIDKARMFVGWVDEPSRWEPSPLPHVRLLHLPPGPTWRAADCGLVRMPSGTVFPWHVHDGGDEVTLVLQGRARYTGGIEVAPGDELVATPGSVHHFAVHDGDEYVFAVRFFAIRPVPPPAPG